MTQAVDTLCVSPGQVRGARPTSTEQNDLYLSLSEINNVGTIWVNKTCIKRV